MTMEVSVGAVNKLNKLMGLVSQNIANSSSPGYKAATGSFEAMVTGGSLVNNQFSGGGCIMHISQNVRKQGNFINTDQASNLSIVGGGLFVGSPNAHTQSLVYTAAGDATVYPDGSLITSGGVVLKGWKTDKNGAPMTSLNQTSLENINVKSKTEYFVQSTKMAMKANLSVDTLVNGAPTEINFPVVDALGQEHSIKASFVRTSITPNTWAMSLSCPDAVGLKQSGTVDDYGGATPVLIRFDAEGTPVSFDGKPNPPALDVQWDPAKTNAQGMTIVMDLGVVGQDNGLVSRAPSQVPPKVTQDGVKMTNASGFEIAEGGLVSIVYSSGVRLPVYQLAVANFPALDRLDPVPGNAFIQTNQSGDPELGIPNRGGFGKIVSSQVELSNVDFAEQLTAMIKIQQLNAGNAKSISTDDRMMQDILAIR